jgi:site-specific recombinase XerD
VDLLQVQQCLGHQSILTTAKYTHLTERTGQRAIERIDALMAGFEISWGAVR